MGYQLEITGWHINFQKWKLILLVWEIGCVVKRVKL